MKKKLEAELISIAHKVLQLKDGSTVPQLQEEARKLYEKLTVLRFAEAHFSDVKPTIGQIISVLEETPPVIIEEKIAPVQPKPIISLQEDPVEEDVSETMFSLDDNVIESPIREEEARPEIIIEKINEKVTEDLFVPASTVTEENISLSEATYEKNDIADIGYVGDSMPIIDTADASEEKPKSLNDQLKRGINIGLNDRLAFIKHLFDGSSTDYNRVLSQLNSLNSRSGARQFIKNMVKPDYNNWQGKSEYEERFMEIVSNRYEF